jgi:hypothetical protein
MCGKVIRSAQLSALAASSNSCNDSVPGSPVIEAVVEAEPNQYLWYLPFYDTSKRIKVQADARRIWYSFKLSFFSLY